MTEARQPRPARPQPAAETAPRVQGISKEDELDFQENQARKHGVHWPSLMAIGGYVLLALLLVSASVWLFLRR